MSKTIVGIVLLSAGSAMGSVINKGPDLGNFWYPLSAFGTYVYADSFVAPAGDTQVAFLGTWLNDQGSGGTSVRFEIWGDTGGFGPDASNVIASTGSIGAFATGGVLTHYQAPASGTLVPGQTYWFAATTVGESGAGFYNVGGHTQNSVYNDNGTFWYSNDPSGVFFDGQNLTPEMAFTVELVPVPAPAGMGLLGVASIAAMRRRRA